MKTNNKLFVQVSLGAIILSIALVVYSLYADKDFLRFDKSEEALKPYDLLSTSTPTEVATSTTKPHVITPQPVTSIEPADPVVQEWKHVVNKKYGFSYYDPEITPPFSVDIYKRPESLKDFVESMWTINKYDTNPYAKDKVISGISTLPINGSPAYQFTLSNSFATDNNGSGYLLDEPHLYTFFETKTGTKIVIHFPLKSGNDSQPNLYASILSSFRIDENLIPKDVIPTNWQTVDKDLYAFKYPGNLFKIDTENSLDKTLYLNDIVEGMRGGISVTIQDTPFDKNDIWGMYGEVEDPEEMSIGKRVWYSYMWGDAGASARIYLTPINTTQTLRISFGSMIEEEVYPIVTDIDLQQEILATFSE